MQNSHLKLQEIIWEITGKCNNGCEYCGSKDAWNTPIDDDVIIKIAQNIAKFPPAEIDMSGGDPLLVNFETHKTIVGILKDKGVKCKIIINPKSTRHPKSYTTSIIAEILKLYDWIGLSVNNEEELKLLINGFPIEKSTIISNFNLQNVFLYNEIEEFVKKNNLMWQVQYTMYQDQNNPLAIYNNEKALKFFSKQISESICNGVKILIADNANCGGCGAGLHSIGMLYNGDVVPCLSMRSWVDIKDVVVGNILEEDWLIDPLDKTAELKYKENPLKYIWENRFNKYRFESFKCCKDHCGNKRIEINLIEKKQKKSNNFEEELDIFKKTEPIFPPPYRVVLYGVTPGNVKVYGVTYPEGTYIYACPGDWQDGTTAIYAVKTPPVYAVGMPSSIGSCTSASICNCNINLDTKDTTGEDDKKKNKGGD